MDPFNFPTAIFVVSFLLLWFASWAGGRLGQRQYKLKEEMLPDFSVVLGATLTLLGLIIGFSFSMAVARYEQRKNYEEAEANAIGTEYVRADLLPAADAQRLRALLATYTNQRILFYAAREDEQLRRINADTAQLQNQLWSTVAGAIRSQPTPLAALVASGMNDVLNSQGYTQAAWWNRIPVSAWALMITIAICCNLLIGYSVARTRE